MAGAKKNKIEYNNTIQTCVDYILNEKAGWAQFTEWYMEKYNTNRQQANRLWSKAWEIITLEFEDNIKNTINQTLLELESLKEEAKESSDRRIWLETIKYQNKIRGGEVERIEAKIDGNIELNWGDNE